MIQSYADAQQFMGAVLVAKDGKVLLDKAYGFRNVEKKIPNTTDTRFYIASNTKQFTAAAVMLLEDRAKLSVEDPVGKYLSGLPTAWAGIPLKNLLTHTSGIPDWENRPEVRQVRNRPLTPDKMLAFVSAKPLDFAPDTSYRYSNTNYVLLGLVVEKISGQRFGDFLQTNIFKPLHMDETRYNVGLTDVSPYVSRPGGLDVEPPAPRDYTSNLGDSGISTTTGDLLKWQQALFGDKVLSPASLTKMTTPYKNDRGVNGNNGYGLVVRAPHGGLRYVHHGGSIPGFQSEVSWYRDLKMSVIVLENVEPRKPAPSAGEMRAYLVDILTGKEVPAPVVHREILIRPSVLADYAATYALSPTSTIIITREEDQLYAEASGAWRLPIFAEAEDRFFAKGLEVQFEFVRDGRGKVTSVVMMQPEADNRLGVRK